MGRVVRSEAELAQILARPGFRVASQIGGERVNTDAVGANGCSATISTRGAQPTPLGATANAASPGTLYALVSLCRAARLPEPVPEYQFHETRRWRFDYAWPMRMLALEVEGGLWTQGRHTRGAGALADLEKYSEAAIAGWRVIYATPGDLTTTGLERVRRAIGS